MRKWTAAVLILGALTGCSPGVPRTVVMLPPTAQARSFLGDTLYAVPVDPSLGPELVRALQEARNDVARRPNNLEARLRYAARTRDLGRIREAIGLYTEVMRQFPRDQRAREQRATLLLTVRELDLAIADLQNTGLDNLTDETFFFHRWGFLHLGFAYYLRAEYARAQVTFAQAWEQAVIPDDATLALFWLFLSIRRQGQDAEAREALTRLSLDSLPPVRTPEVNLLLAYRGVIRMEDLPVDLTGPLRTAEDALYGYGVGVALLLLGRRDEAALLFQRVRNTPNWTSWGYIASERELARMAEEREGRP